MTYIISTILLYALLIEAVFICSYSIYLNVKSRTLAIQFNWLITSYLFAIVLYVVSLYFDVFFYQLQHYQYLIIYLSFIIFLYLALFFSKYHKLFLNIFSKKLYFYISIISIYVLLFIMIFLMITSPFIITETLPQSYIKLFNVYHDVFYLFFIIPCFSIIIFLIMMIKNGNLLKPTIKLMYFFYILQFLVFLTMCVFPKQFLHEGIFTIFLLCKFIFNFFLIKNVVLEGGRYLC